MKEKGMKEKLHAQISPRLNQQPNQILAEARAKLLENGFRPYFDRHYGLRMLEFWRDDRYSARIDVSRLANGAVTKVICRELREI